MGLVVPNTGKIQGLNAIRYGLLDVTRIRPYVNDLTPGPDTNWAEFEFVDGRGLDSIDLTPRSNWTDATMVGEVAQIQYGSVAQQWTLSGSGPVTVYGYAVANEDGDTCLWAERVPDPITMQPGGTLQILPVLTLGSEY